MQKIPPKFCSSGHWFFQQLFCVRRTFKVLTLYKTLLILSTTSLRIFLTMTKQKNDDDLQTAWGRLRPINIFFSFLNCLMNIFNFKKGNFESLWHIEQSWLEISKKMTSNYDKSGCLKLQCSKMTGYVCILSYSYLKCA